MYKTTLNNSNNIQVNYKNHTFSYSTDDSKPNPFEALFAAINACAGVYAIKACQKLNISFSDIEIETSLKNIAENKFHIFGINGIHTKITFPNSFPEDKKEYIIDSIKSCAVKEFITNGEKIDFSISHN